MQTVFPSIKNNIKHVLSTYIVTGSSENHSIVLNVLFSDTTKSNKKRPKNIKQELNKTAFKTNAMAELQMPHNAGNEVQVFSMSDLLSLYHIHSKDQITAELVTDITNDIIIGKCLLDYLIVERKDLPILKIFARKFNKIGLMPSLEEGTIVENYEEFQATKKRLVSSNVHRVHKFHKTISFKVGCVTMSINDIEENLSCLLSWLLKNHTKKEFTRLFLNTFNSNSEIILSAE